MERRRLAAKWLNQTPYYWFAKISA